MTKEQWLRIDTVENALDNLEMTLFFLNNVEGEIKWKWAVIAMHQALYGFAICATTPSNSSFALKKPENHESQLISIWEALCRAQDEDWVNLSIFVPLVLSDDEKLAIGKLSKEFRNEFEHFRPKSWSIEVSGMPVIFMNVLRVIRHLALESHSVTYGEEELEERTKMAVANLEKALVDIASN